MTLGKGWLHARPEPGAPARGARLLKESALLYGSVYVLVFLKFASGFLVAKFLGPATYGLRAAFGIAVDYQPFTQLGLNDAMHKQVPYFRAKGDHESADRILSNVFWVNVLVATALCLASGAVGTILYLRGTEQIFVDFAFFLGLYGVLSRIRAFYSVQPILEKRTYDVVRIRSLDSALNAVFSVVFVYLYGLRGLLGGLLLAALISAAYEIRLSRWVPAMRISWSETAGLVRIGFPIMTISLLFLLFQNVDKMLILSMLSREKLGYFAVAVIVSALVFRTVGDVFRVMFFPRVMEQVGRSADLRLVKPLLTEPTVLVAYFVPFLVGVMYLSVHLPLLHFAPEYGPAIEVARVLMLGQFFFASAVVPLLVCVALNRQNVVVVLMCGVIAFDAALNFAFIRMGWGIVGVALGTGISYFVLGLSATLLALRLFDAGIGEIARFLARLMVPFVYCIALLLLLDRWVVTADDFWSDAVGTAAKIAVFCVAFSLVLLTIRAHPAIAMLRDYLPGRRSVPTAVAVGPV